MKFSVIVAIYNTSKYLVKCLESIIKQTYIDWEAILVDDGSNDGSGDICDIYKEKDYRFRVIHKENAGQGLARNDALEIATGKYVIFLDSDDWLELSLLDFLSEIIKEYDFPDIITYEFNVYNERTAKRSKINKNNFKTNIIKLDRKGIWGCFLREDKIGGFACNKCVRKELVDFYNIKFPKARAREDTFFCVRLLRYVENGVVTDFRGYNELLRYGSTEQRKFNKDFLFSLENCNEILNYTKNEFIDLLGEANIKILRTKMGLIAGMVEVGYEKKNCNDYLRLKEQIENERDLIDGLADSDELRREWELFTYNNKRWIINNKLHGLKNKLIRFKRFLYHFY